MGTSQRIGLAVGACLVTLILLILLTLLSKAGTGAPTELFASTYFRRVLGFTFLQATLSAVISVLLAIPLARAFARQGTFPGRRILLALLSVPIVLPTLIAVFGIVAIYGRNGLAAQSLASTGLDADWNIYGLQGVVLAHVFLNLPLGLRLLLPAWQSIPSETWRLAGQLNIRGWDALLLIEWPVLRRYLPQVMATIFLICTTSFAIVLALGGGPGAATLEVAVFQALRFEYNPPMAASLALIGLVINGVLMVLAQKTIGTAPLGTTHQVSAIGEVGKLARLVDYLVMGIAALLIGSPLLAVLIDGLGPQALADIRAAAHLRAILISLGLAVPAALTGSAMALAFVVAESQSRQSRPRLTAWFRFNGLLPAAMSPMALTLGLYLILSSFLDGRARTIVGVILLNALVVVPFVIAVMRPAFERSFDRHDRLCRSLGIFGWHRWKIVDWPSVRPSLGTALALATCLALGDLAGISVFGDPEIRTLTVLLYDQLAAYRMDQAALTAASLMILVFVVHRGIERGVGGRGGA